MVIFYTFAIRKLEYEKTVYFIITLGYFICNGASHATYQ